jgi:hypothetical protein
MAKIKSQAMGFHKGALLGHVGAQNLAKGLVKKVGGRVMPFEAFPTFLVYLEGACFANPQAAFCERSLV